MEKSITIAELEAFIARIREAGGNDDTQIKVLSKNTVKRITRTTTYHSSGFPILTVQ